MPDAHLLEALSFWNPWGREPFETGVPRTAREACLPWLGRPEVLAVCGMRRSGKSTLLRQLAAARIAAGLPARDVLFVNFEDPVFLDAPLDVRALDRAFATYFETVAPVGTPYLFLDEVQNVAGWARWVRSRVETGRAHIAVTGSSSRLLEPELATILTGRTVPRTLWPLSFREFLRFRDIRAETAADLLGRAPLVRQALARYLRFGGLPEVALASDDDVATTLLRQYFRDILYRDVVSRHEIRDVRALERVAHHYLSNTANLSTYNRVKNTHGLAMDQVRSYTSYLDESYLIREVPRFSHKTSAQSRAPRKVYAIDTGLRNAVAYRFSPDLGRLAETAVHGALARDDELRLYYYQGKRECDFVVWRGAEALAAVQVCYDPRDELTERELAGLVEAMEATGAREGVVVTHGLDETRNFGGRRLALRPLWRWLWEQDAEG